MIIRFLIILLLVLILIKIHKCTVIEKLDPSVDYRKYFYPIELDDLYVFNTLVQTITDFMKGDTYNFRSSFSINKPVNIGSHKLSNVAGMLKLENKTKYLTFGKSPDLTAPAEYLFLPSKATPVNIPNMTTKTIIGNTIEVKKINYPSEFKPYELPINADTTATFMSGSTKITAVYSSFYDAVFFLEGFSYNPSDWANIKIRSFTYLNDNDDLYKTFFPFRKEKADDIDSFFKATSIVLQTTTATVGACLEKIFTSFDFNCERELG
jgi:hypothetical protein